MIRIKSRINPYLYALSFMITFIISNPASALPGEWQALENNGTPWLQNITSRIETSAGVFTPSDSRYKLKTYKLPVSDIFSQGTWSTIDARDTKKIMDIHILYRQDKEGRLLAKLWCRNVSAKPIHVNNFVVIDGVRPGSWVGGRAFKFGTDGTQAMQQNQSYGSVYVTATNQPSFTGAFLSAKRNQGTVTVSPIDGGLRIVTSISTDKLLLQPGAKIESGLVWMSAGANPSDELESWTDLFSRWDNLQISKNNTPKPISANISKMVEERIPYGLIHMNTPVHKYEQWDRDWRSYLALMGNAAIDSNLMKPEQFSFMRRLLPSLISTGKPRDIWERDIPAVIEQKLSAGGENWRVLGLFNWNDKTANVRLNLDRIWDENRFPVQGIPAKSDEVGKTDRKYVLYDFWNQRLLGKYTGSASFKLPEKSGRVIVVREIQNHPQILSIGDHIGQGVEELRESRWDAGIQTLTCTTQGRRGATNTVVRMYIPEGWKIRSVAVNNKSASWEEYHPEVIRLEIPDKNGPVTWRATFDGSPELQPKSRPVNPGLITEIEQ
ncbi:MAG: hypothetical protein ACYC27_01335 [Armatimonadota bacterium]